MAVKYNVSSKSCSRVNYHCYPTFYQYSDTFDWENRTFLRNTMLALMYIHHINIAVLKIHCSIDR